MTAKEYLSQYRDVVRRSIAIQHHIDELEEIATRTTPNYSATGSGKNQSGDKLGAIVSQIADAKSRASDELELLIATEREIEDAIRSVKDIKLSTLLYERYINGKTFEKIAAEMNYSWRQTIRMHGEALLAVKDVI